MTTPTATHLGSSKQAAPHWPLLVLMQETNPQSREAASAGLDRDSLRRLVTDLGKSLGRRQPPPGGARCCVVAADGTLAGVLWSRSDRIGFLVPPHPHLSPQHLAAPGALEQLRALYHDCVQSIAIADKEDLATQLQEARAACAARLLGVSTHLLGSGTAAERQAVRQFLDAAHPDEIEFFTPAEEVPPQNDRKALRGTHASVNETVEQLLTDYGAPNAVHACYAGAYPMPKRRTVVPILRALQWLLFPGYHGPRPNSHHFPTAMRRKVSWLRQRLAVEVARALRFQNGDDLSDDDYESWGREKADALIVALPELLKALDDDVAAAFQKDPAVWSHEEIPATYPGIYATFVYRVAHILHESGVPILPRMMTEYAHSKTAIDIHPGAKIKPGFFIDHGSGVVIGGTCEIGRNVTLYQGVTLGALNFPRDEDGQLLRGLKRHPTLEDNVVVYSNASILGGDTVVGRNSIIGANVWLHRSVPPESVILLEHRELRYKQRQPLACENAGWSI